MLLKKFPSGPLNTNAILIVCTATKKAAVIDPSYGSHIPIFQYVKEHEIELEKILLTHSHWDHIADAKAFHLPVYVHRLDSQNLERPGSDKVPCFIPIDPVKPKGFFEDGDKIHIGLIEIEVIHTPGHCPGAVCFYIPKEAVLISGDTLFRGAIGTLNLPTADPESMWESLGKLSKLPKDTRVIPGHGSDTTIGNEITNF
jgi:hydroxyacylglutathione hydrolase